MTEHETDGPCPCLDTVPLADDGPTLVDLSTIARMLGVSRQRAHQWAADPTFPRPIFTVGDQHLRVWARSTVLHWATARKNGGL